MKLNQKIFREYDIRGTVDVDLSNDFAYLLGRAFATLAKENKRNNIAIGYDCRLSSPDYADALCKGLSDEGINSTNLGMGPTPQTYYATYTHGFGGAIQVTGSHNPADMNGFKLCLGTSTLSGGEIHDLYKKCERLNGSEPRQRGIGVISRQNILPEYTNELIQRVKSHMGSRKLKVVCDAGNGVGGITGPQVLKALGCEVIELFCEPDGTFPNHHPDPTELKNIQSLISKVKETNADLGIGWDGDADRIAVVDENGTPIFGDMLTLIFGRAILKEAPGATIIGDVKCSNLLFDDINAKGGNAIMWKTGHSLIKAKLKETNADLAGEMSGHIFFNNRFFGFDDAVFASARLVEILSNTHLKTSELLEDLPKMFSTPEIRLDCPEESKFKVSELAKKAFSKYKVDTTDGARITFEHGWGLIRASNTQPILVMRFEATSSELLKIYQNEVENSVDQIIASIR